MVDGVLTATLIFLTIAGKLTALAKDVVFARFFGASPGADAYFVANLLPGALWLAMLTTIGAVFAPMYVRAMSDRTAAARLINEAVRFYFYAAILLAALLWAFAAPLVAVIAPAADAHTQRLAVKLARIMSLGFVFTGYVGVQSALQQANRRFVAPLAVPVVNNLLAAGAIVIAYWLDDIAVAVAGAVGAYLIQAVVQRTQTRDLYRTCPGFRVRAETWQRLSLLSAPMIVAVMLDQINLMIGTAIASDFGSGSISHLTYANRLALLVSGTFSWLIAYMFFPDLAANAARNDDDANALVLARAVGLVLVITAPAAAVALALPSEIVTLVYFRGAFGGEDVRATAGLFGILGIGIIFSALRELMNRVYFSYQKTMAPLLIGLVATAANLAGSALMSRVYGIEGIAAGLALAALVFCAGQFALMALWKPQLLTARMGRYFLASLTAGVIAYVLTLGGREMASDWPMPARLLVAMATAGCAYLAALAAVMRLLGVRPAQAFAELGLGRLKE